jgi:hypothetical protein
MEMVKRSVALGAGYGKMDEWAEYRRLQGTKTILLAICHYTKNDP